VPIADEGGKLVFVAAGRNKAAAEAQAKQVVEQMNKEGTGVRALDEAKLYDFDQDVALASQVRVGSPEYMTAASLVNQLKQQARKPQTFKKRSGVGGFKDEFTKEELIDRLNAHLTQRTRYIAELSVNKQLGDELAKLAVEDPKLYNELVGRLNSLAGKQGEMAKRQNQIVDKVLSPVLGKNSADKVVHVANQTMHHLMLGMGNIAFPLVNAMTFMQTVLPKVAFTMTASKPELLRHYTFYPMAGADLRPKGGVGVLDMLKLMRQSFREMGKPDASFRAQFERAVRDGVVDPRFIEEALGENSRNVTKFRDVLKGEEGFSKYLLELSNFLPGQSEKFARGHAFTVGHMMGRDFFDLKDDQLFRFAKEFTEQTMFNYGVADRARVMTAPLGSMFGLFKNWQAHYIASFLDYAGGVGDAGNRNALYWMMGGTWASGGITALPFYGAANALSKWATDESLMTHVYNAMGGADDESMTGGLGDAVFFGLPSFLGLTLSSQVAGPLADPARDASMLFSFVHLDRMMALGKAVGAAIDQASVTGQHPLDSDYVRDQFVRTFAPKNITRAVSLTEDMGIRSLNTGNKIIGNLNTAEQLMYTLGLMPRRVALAHQVNEELWQKQEDRKTMVTELGRAWEEAEREKDWDTLWKLQRTAMTRGVDLSSVIKSAKTRERNRREPTMERQFDPVEVMKYKGLGLVP
jgi:hypothetical protein